ncbi:putative small lipoprotein YifL [Hoeflea marina]|uniref:Putative small lipoprotein YifL n=1 Tax=Hoeflea marina TaxID=274592 RepID=A0A317PIL1_9HYPH|nr:lipoprotein [Hoeflea marina]PWV98083.1 putative small lipoprotein YifL [Hoeflea marina]
MTISPWVKTICTIAVLTVALSGCGRKGGLERPGATMTNPPAQGTETTPPVEDRRFILDGLLE